MIIFFDIWPLVLIVAFVIIGFIGMLMTPTALTPFIIAGTIILLVIFIILITAFKEKGAVIFIIGIITMLAFCFLVEIIAPIYNGSSVNSVGNNASQIEKADSSSNLDLVRSKIVGKKFEATKENGVMHNSISEIATIEVLSDETLHLTVGDYRALMQPDGLGMDWDLVEIKSSSDYQYTISKNIVGRLRLQFGNYSLPIDLDETGNPSYIEFYE